MSWQSDITGTSGTVKVELQAIIEIDPQRLLACFTRWILRTPVLAFQESLYSCGRALHY